MLYFTQAFDNLLCWFELSCFGVLVFISYVLWFFNDNIMIRLIDIWRHVIEKVLAFYEVGINYILVEGD